MTWQLPARYHRILYIFGLMLTASGLPLSKFLISTSVFWVGLNWLWEGNFAVKWKRFIERPAIAVLMGVFVLHLIGLLWSTDLKAGWSDIRIKLPLLLFPLLVGTSETLTKKELALIIGSFVIAVFISSAHTFLVASGWLAMSVDDLRKASRFVSLIRLSLMVNLAIFWLGQSLFRSITIWRKTAAVLGICWFVFFLIHMQSLTGLVVMAIVSVVVVFLFMRWQQRKKVVLGLLVVLLSTLCYVGIEGWKAWHQFYNFQNENSTRLDSISKYGGIYTHDLKNPMRENGYLVNIYICKSELDSTWSVRSKIPLNDGRTRDGGYIYYVLLRYMASKGLHKDAEGMQQMTAQDIQNVEEGLCNVKWPEMSSLHQRLYQVFWEFDLYKNTGDASGKSVTTRFELAHNALACIVEKPLLGYGTGGTENAFRTYYTKNSWGLSESYHWLHTHNQFLSIALTLGIGALLYFIFALIYPMSSQNRWSSYFSVAFFIVIVLSFLNDDTLETQQGATLFAFFYALVVFALPQKETSETVSTRLAKS